MEITWEVAATIVGSLVVIAGFLIQALKKDPIPHPKENELSTEHETRLSVLESKLHELERRIEELKESLIAAEEINDKNLDRVSDKLEKLTDLMITFIQNEKKN